MSDAEIVNVVASGGLGREIDIHAVGDDIEAEEVKSSSGEYGTPTAYIRKTEDAALLTVYESGSYHISGAKSVEEAEEIRDWFVGELERLGIGGLDVTFGVKNVVVVGDLEKEVDLNRLMVKFGFENTEYEPEQFPGLIYRPEEFDCIYLIFSSGRVVIPGSSTPTEGFEAFEMIQEQLAE